MEIIELIRVTFLTLLMVVVVVTGFIFMLLAFGCINRIIDWIQK